MQCCCKLFSSGTFKILLQNRLKGSWRFLQFLKFLESRLQRDRYRNKQESVYWLWMCSYCCAYFVWSLICDIINHFQVSSFTFKCCNSDLCNSAPSSATSSVIGVLASLAVMWWCIHWRATRAALRHPHESSLTTAASQYWCSLINQPVLLPLVHYW